MTNRISEINNPEINHARDIDIVMLRYNLIEYSDNHPKTSGSLKQYYRDKPDLNNNDAIIDFPDYTNSV